MKTVYVVCPGETVTGGPELLHQLVHTLTNLGQTAAIVYYPFDRQFEVPKAYKGYEVIVAKRNDIVPGSDVVLPEMYPELLSSFRGCRTNLWWLSVDNFFDLRLDPRIRRRVPAWLATLLTRILAPHALRLAKRADRHLCQSEYARLFLAERRMGPSFHLGDFLNPDYLSRIGAPSAHAREDIVAYNPLKGRERTAQVVAALQTAAGERIRAVPIVNMQRADVQDLLSSAKVYIDFGHHPGKDRIPREAAASGACVLINRRGSAANDVDVAVSDYYRIDDRSNDFAAEAAAKIAAIVDDFDVHRAAFDSYRASIAAEPSKFVDDARSLFVD